MPTIREHFGLSTVQPFIPTFKISEQYYPVRSAETIGIEVEVENVTRVGSGINGLWQEITDGSLRNNGREYITLPFPANFAPDALNNLLTVGLSNNCSFSPRTSVHVHLNMQDMTTDKVGDLLLVYTVFENALFRFVGKSRARNPYCVPITQTSLLRGWATHSWRARWEKYAGLNLNPLQDKGTVEFRHMHGTFDVRKLAIWIDLITSLKEYVKNNPTKAIRSRLSALTPNDVPELMKDVFGPSSSFVKFESVDEFQTPIRMMKYTMAGRNNTQAVKAGVTVNSDFFKVKD